MTQTADNNQATAVVEEQGLLERAVAATKQTEKSQAEALLKNLTESALKGTVTWNKNLFTTFNNAIQEIDKLLSKQLRAIMHQADFLKLEGSWRGLHHLVQNSETGSQLRIKFMSLTKREIAKDLAKAPEFDQSQTFKKIYEAEYGMPGGEPYSTLIGDFEFTNHPEDMQLLRDISSIAAAGFCPFISAGSAQLFGFDNWTELANPRDLEKIFDSVEYAKWQSFRETEDSRFVTLTCPRALARLPYGSMSLPVEEFQYEESVLQAGEATAQLEHHEYCWMNAAYLAGTCITNAFAKYGWTTAIRGAEGGGKVENLPLHTFKSDDGDADSKCPTEVGITDRREAELSKLGFLPLCHYKNTDYAVFFGAQTANKPKKYDKPEATANAAISARLPYIMAVSRFAHYLKVMARDKIGSFMEASDCEEWLNRWIKNYVNTNTKMSQDDKAKFPLADAKVQVKEVPGQPGVYNAVAWLRPWLQMEELTTSLRLVARIPQLNK